MLSTMTVYIIKLHSATQYKNIAMAVKKTSFALYERFNTFASQDEKQAENLYKEAIESGDYSVAHIELFPILAIDNIDTDQNDITIDAVKQAIACEEYSLELMHKAELKGFYYVANSRQYMLKRILKFLQEEKLYGQATPAYFECSACGHIVKDESQNPVAYPPDNCQVCGANYTEFVRYHEIGGW